MIQMLIVGTEQQGEKSQIHTIPNDKKTDLQGLQIQTRDNLNLQNQYNILSV